MSFLKRRKKHAPMYKRGEGTWAVEKAWLFDSRLVFWGFFNGNNIENEPFHGEGVGKSPKNTSSTSFSKVIRFFFAGNTVMPESFGTPSFFRCAHDLQALWDHVPPLFYLILHYFSWFYQIFPYFSPPLLRGLFNREFLIDSKGNPFDLWICRSDFL